MIPCSIEIILMGVASPGMRAVSSVLGTVPTIGLDIARHINEYQVSNLRCYSNESYFHYNYR